MNPTTRKLAAAGALAGAAALGAAAFEVQRRAREAEAQHPPQGSFITIDGVELHFLEKGNGDPPVLMLHGNGAMTADFSISGLVSAVSKTNRTLVVDRPGYGYSARPRALAWTPEEQADLFAHALSRLKAKRAIVFGHSWGTLPALAMALDHSDRVAALVLGSGFYYPQARADIALLSPPAIPVIGDVMRHTVSPLMMRAMAPEAIAKMFAPRPVTPVFEQFFPLGLALRPSQIRASAEEVAMMNAAAARLSGRYGEIACPVAILAGEADEIVNTAEQSVRLHADIAHSSLTVLPGTGHMIHHAAPQRIAEIITKGA